METYVAMYTHNIGNTNLISDLFLVKVKDERINVRWWYSKSKMMSFTIKEIICRAHKNKSEEYEIINEYPEDLIEVLKKDLYIIQCNSEAVFKYNSDEEAIERFKDKVKFADSKYIFYKIVNSFAAGDTMWNMQYLDYPTKIYVVDKNKDDYNYKKDEEDVYDFHHGESQCNRMQHNIALKVCFINRIYNDYKVLIKILKKLPSKINCKKIILPYDESSTKEYFKKHDKKSYFAFAISCMKRLDLPIKVQISESFKELDPLDFVANKRYLISFNLTSDYDWPKSIIKYIDPDAQIINVKSYKKANYKKAIERKI